MRMRIATSSPCFRFRIDSAASCHVISTTCGCIVHASGLVFSWRPVPTAVPHYTSVFPLFITPPPPENDSLRRRRQPTTPCLNHTNGVPRHFTIFLSPADSSCVAAVSSVSKSLSFIRLCIISAVITATHNVYTRHVRRYRYSRLTSGGTSHQSCANDPCRHALIWRHRPAPSSSRIGKYIIHISCY